LSSCTRTPSGSNQRRSDGSDDGFAATDIALHQARHRLRGQQIGIQFAKHPLLRTGQSERQRCQQLALQLRRISERSGLFVARRATQLHQGQLVRQQLLKSEASLGRMARGGELKRIGAERGLVNEFNRGRERWKAERLKERRGQVLDRSLAREFLQRPLHQGAQPPLRNPLGGRIHRRQGLRERRGALIEAAVLGMDDLGSERPATDFAVAANARAARESLALRVGEMKEAQGK